MRVRARIKLRLDKKISEEDECEERHRKEKVVYHPIQIWQKKDLKARVSLLRDQCNEQDTADRKPGAPAREAPPSSTCAGGIWLCIESCLPLRPSLSPSLRLGNAALKEQESDAPCRIARYMCFSKMI